MGNYQGKPLIGYVIAVIVVWILILIITRFVASTDRFKIVLVFACGFMIGMLAMYIAVHIYKWR
jgi:hypothetical protein